MDNIKIPGIVSFRKCTLSDSELLEKVGDRLGRLYQFGEIPMRHIPARPDDDFDLLVGELMMRYFDSINKTEQIEQIERLKPAANTLIEKYWKNKGTSSEFITCITPNSIPDYWTELDEALQDSKPETEVSQ